MEMWIAIWLYFWGFWVMLAAMNQQGCIGWTAWTIAALWPITFPPAFLWGVWTGFRDERRRRKA
jgi:hypothetical protein